MKIELRFFAGVRESLETAQESLTVPPHVRTVGDVRAHLCERGGVWADTLSGRQALRTAYNHVMSDAATPITEGCEVAFFPPVTGG